MYFDSDMKSLIEHMIRDGSEFTLTEWQPESHNKQATAAAAVKVYTCVNLCQLHMLGTCFIPRHHELHKNK